MTIPVEIKGFKIGEGIPKICVPLTSVSKSQLCEETKKVKESQPDVVEWRADFYEDLFCIPEMLKTMEMITDILKDIPLLFTIRTKAEGGNVGISMEDYVEINLAAANGTADLVDVEVFSEDMTGKSTEKNGDMNAANITVSEAKKILIDKLHETNVKVIASSHDFYKTDEKDQLLARFQAMDKSGADILKMAVMPECAEDVQAIMLATDEMRRKYTNRPLIAMSMGYLGAVSRVEGEGFGSSLTFATVGAASAPGQIPIEELREKMAVFHSR